MNKWRKRLSSRLTQLMLAALSYMPFLARADWADTANSELLKVRVGIYMLTGTAAVGTMIWKGARWMIARSQGDHSVTAMDYIQQCIVIIIVGGSVALAVYAWGLYASSTGG